MTGDIKNYVSTCEACREYEQGQRKETLTSHEVPSRPWQFVAADLFELNGKSPLLLRLFFNRLRYTACPVVIPPIDSLVR